MLKREIKFDDFDGNPASEVHYFHLSKSKIIKMEMAGGGKPLTEQLKAIATSGNGKEIVQKMEEVVLAAYGLRDPANPSKFKQSDAISAEFRDTLPFDALLTELLMEPTAAVDFIIGALPKNLVSEEEMTAAVAKALEDVNLPDPNGLDGENAAWPRGEVVASEVVPAEKSIVEDEELKNTGLEHPYLSDGKIVPWAYREPTNQEMTKMEKHQFTDIYRRKSSGWTPPANV